MHSQQDVLGLTYIPFEALKGLCYLVVMTFRNIGCSLVSNLFRCTPWRGTWVIKSQGIWHDACRRCGRMWKDPHLIIGDTFLYLWLRGASGNEKGGKGETERENKMKANRERHWKSEIIEMQKTTASEWDETSCRFGIRSQIDTYQKSTQSQ